MTNIGFRPKGDGWDVKEFDVLSTSTVGQFAPCLLGAARTVIEATSASTRILGITANASANSLPAGKIQVYVPKQDTNAVFRTNVQTGVAQSAFTVYFPFNIEKSGNTFRADADSSASAIVQTVGAIDSTTSEVDCVFLTSVLALGSGSTIL